MRTVSQGILDFEDEEYIRKYGYDKWLKKGLKKDFEFVKLLGIVAIVSALIGVVLLLSGKLFMPLALISVFPFGLAGFMVLGMIFMSFYLGIEYILHSWDSPSNV